MTAKFKDLADLLEDELTPRGGAASFMEEKKLFPYFSGEHGQFKFLYWNTGSILQQSKSNHGIVQRIKENSPHIITFAETWVPNKKKEKLEGLAEQLGYYIWQLPAGLTPSGRPMHRGCCIMIKKDFSILEPPTDEMEYSPGIGKDFEFLYKDLYFDLNDRKRKLRVFVGYLPPGGKLSSAQSKIVHAATLQDQDIFIGATDLNKKTGHIIRRATKAKKSRWSKLKFVPTGSTNKTNGTENRLDYVFSNQNLEHVGLAIVDSPDINAHYPLYQTFKFKA